MNKPQLFLILLLANLSSLAQTPKQVSVFPSSYVGKTITFKNVAFLPSLHEMKGFFLVGIDVANGNPSEEFGFGSLDKITGVVPAEIAKQMVDKNISGYGTFYYGTITGTVIKRSLNWSSAYIFRITKIINHPLGQESKVVNVFKVK